MIIFLKKLIPRPVFKILQPIYHLLLAFWAASIYDFPSGRMKVIGVTGTKGKTTVIELLHAILSESGFKVASLSSLRFKIRGHERINDKKMTMPGRFFVQKFLSEARRKKCQYAILEVTSEGIKQFRHRFIDFHAAIMTNVAPEHLESHGGFENYLRAKLDLFWRLKKNSLAIINRDDEKFQRFFAATPAQKIFYSQKKIEIKGKIYDISDVEISSHGLKFKMDGEEFFSPLLGDFNFANVLAVTAAALALDLDFHGIKKGLRKVSGVAGRLEFVQTETFAVVVDYAHTPDSLKAVYNSLRKIRPEGKLICVLGATGGGRDKWKRPEFGKIAEEFCQEIILTNEDPYDENPEKILQDIEKGIKVDNFKNILDRREAIREALKSAREGDTVVITGKGAETWIMGPNGKKTPWDDRKVVREELGKIKN